MRGTDRIADTDRANDRGSRLLLVAILLIWLSVSLPLVLGLETLYYRDVFSTHLHFKAFGAQELAAGRIPAFNPSWALGQPFRGNPNTLAFYPGNILYLLLPFWSAFNLHYVLHWLLSFLTMRSLARELGQGPLASLAAGLTYAGCGWMLASLSFYNLLTVAAWWPLAMLGAIRGGRRGLAIGGMACGLALLGGEPVTALLGMFPLLWVAIGRRGLRMGAINGMIVGGIGLLIALPQLVATLRVIGFTYRGAHGLPITDAGYSLNPLRLLELLVPLPFGIPSEMGPSLFWATRIGDAPYFSSLYLGIVGLGLAMFAAARRPRWMVPALLGLGLAWLGGLFPGPLVQASGGLFRYPEKFLFWFALMSPLLVGWGVEDVGRPGTRRLRPLWIGFGSLLLLAFFCLFQGRALIAYLTPGSSGAEIDRILQWQIPSWLMALGFGALLLLLMAAALYRRSRMSLVLLQLAALLPLYRLVPTDATRHYRDPAPWTQEVADGGAVTMSTLDSPLGTERPVYYLTDTSRASLIRIGHLDLDFPTGVLHGLSYPLAPDLEGMHSPLFSLMLEHLPRLEWSQQLNWLRSLGVEVITLAEDPDLEGLVAVDSVDRFGVETTLYRVTDPAPPVWWPSVVSLAENPIVAFAEVTGSDDPIGHVVAARDIEHSASGSVVLLEATPDRVELEVRSDGGLVVVNRAYQPLLRARAQGQILETMPVNLNLLGIVVPPGEHRVSIRASAAPEIASAAVAIVSLVACLVLAFGGRRVGQQAGIPAAQD